MKVERAENTRLKSKPPCLLVTRSNTRSFRVWEKTPRNKPEGPRRRNDRLLGKQSRSGAGVMHSEPSESSTEEHNWFVVCERVVLGILMS